MLYLLNYGGGNLADAVGHGDPTGGADLHLILTLGADHMTILTARYRGSSGDGEAYWTLYRLLQLLQEALCFPSLLAQLHLSLPQPRLQAGQEGGLVPQVTSSRTTLSGLAGGRLVMAAKGGGGVAVDGHVQTPGGGHAGHGQGGAAHSGDRVHEPGVESVWHVRAGNSLLQGGWSTLL